MGEFQEFRDINVNVFAFDRDRELYNAGLCDIDISKKLVFISTRENVMQFIRVYFDFKFFRRKNIIFLMKHPCNGVIMIFEQEKGCSDVFNSIQKYTGQKKDKENREICDEKEIIEQRFLLPFIRKIKEDSVLQKFKHFLKILIENVKDDERERYVNILKKQKSYNLIYNFNQTFEESEESVIDDENGDSDDVSECDDDIIFNIKPEVYGETRNQCESNEDDNDVIVLSDSEEEESTSDDVFIVENNEDEDDDDIQINIKHEDSESIFEMSDEDDVIINVKPEVDDDNEEKSDEDDEDIIVLDSDSEGSEDDYGVEEESQSGENYVSGYNDEELEDDDVILHVKSEVGDNEDEEESVDEQIETSTNIVRKPKPVYIHPTAFMKFIRDLKAHKKDKLLKIKGKPDVAKIVASIPELDEHRELYMTPGFNSAFNALYITATRRKNIDMEHVVLIMERYLTDGHTVEMFDGFPSAPSRPINMYVSEKAEGERNTLQSIVQKRKSFASGEIDTKPYFARYQRECKEFIKKVEEYLSRNRDKLLESHISYIQNVLIKVRKEIENGESESAPRRKKPKRQGKTAFDYYSDAHMNLYPDLSQEKRNSKLLKKFEKLDASEKQIYKNIAAANS